jgi:Domain of unknown function (DUF4124)
MRARGVAACRVSILFACAALFALRPAPATAQEIYRWVDEQGVVHFSDTAPVGESAEVSTLTLEDTRPANYDREEDVFNLEATEQRMQALRDELAAERAARRERAAARPPPVVQYPEQQHFGYSDDYLYGYPPLYPRPPGGRPGRPGNRPRPEPPPSDDDTSTWRPPGRVTESN